jgi:hypothetical protein
MPHRTDPEYFSALETANIAHVLLPAETNRRMDEHFSELQIKRCIPPGKARAGFVFTKRDNGLKPLVVMLVTPGAVKRFTFAVPVPGPELDLQKVDFDRLYGPGGITSLDERGLRLPGQNLHQHGSSATSARGNTPGRAIPAGANAGATGATYPSSGSSTTGGSPSGPFSHGPVIANVMPGVWMFTNSHLPSGLNVAPANSSHDAGVSEPGIVPGRLLMAKS